MAGTAPAGWYPQQDGMLRYWDGDCWTEHVARTQDGPGHAPGSMTIAPGSSATSVAPRSQTGYEPPMNRDDWDQPGYGQVPVPAPSYPTHGRWGRDPFGRHELRWWEGNGWSQHVISQGRQGVDPPGPGPAASVNQKVRRQVVGLGLLTESAKAGVGPLFSEQILVVNQKAKLFEVKAEYAVFDQYGRQVGAVRQVGENFMRKALSPLPDDDRARRLEVLDSSGRAVMKLVRPAKFIKSTVTVSGGDGTEIGQLVQENTRALSGIVRGAVGLIDQLSPVNLENKIGHLGKVRFSIQSRGQILGSIHIEDREQWDFRVQDREGAEIASITRTWAGLAKEWFTKADHYVVQIHRPLEEPLRSLVVAASLAVDTVFRQDSD